MPGANSRHPALRMLWAAFGVLCLVKAAWVVVYNATLTLMWGSVINRVADPFLWMNLFHAWLVVSVVVLLFAALFSWILAAGPSLDRHAGRPWTLAASVLAVVTGPLGIALGTYTMVVTRPQALDQTRASYAPAG